MSNVEQGISNDEGKEVSGAIDEPRMDANM
jgi:hypothetical protein